MKNLKKRATAHNAIGKILNQYHHKFGIDPAFIDCRDLSVNFKDNLIPMVDLANIVDSVIGPWQGRINKYTSTTLAGQILDLHSLTPSFMMVPKIKLVVHPSFNRDTSPNHCLKLERDWLDQNAVCGLGLKMPDKYGGLIYNADTTHTGVNRIRRGDNELPMWVAHVPDKGSYEATHEYALFVAGHLFLAINVRNKRNCCIFDQHFIKVSCGIHPAPQIQNIIDKIPKIGPNEFVQIIHGGNKHPYAIHNLKEVYNTYDLDAKSSRPGQLLDSSIKWLIRNFKHQSIDGCLMSSFALFLRDNIEAGIVLDNTQQDQLAAELISRYTGSNQAQLKIKDAWIGWNNKQYDQLDHPYLVSNGLKYLATKLGLPSVRDDVRNWKKGF